MFERHSGERVNAEPKTAKVKKKQTPSWLMRLAGDSWSVGHPFTGGCERTRDSSVSPQEVTSWQQESVSCGSVLAVVWHLEAGAAPSQINLHLLTRERGWRWDLRARRPRWICSANRSPARLKGALVLAAVMQRCRDGEPRCRLRKERKKKNLPKVVE